MRRLASPDLLFRCRSLDREDALFLSDGVLRPMVWRTEKSFRCAPAKVVASDHTSCGKEIKLETCGPRYPYIAKARIVGSPI
jgi:hypothetical protein